MRGFRSQFELFYLTGKHANGVQLTLEIPTESDTCRENRAFELRSEAECISDSLLIFFLLQTTAKQQPIHISPFLKHGISLFQPFPSSGPN